jgi:hypothetical protein
LPFSYLPSNYLRAPDRGIPGTSDAKTFSQWRDVRVVEIRSAVHFMFYDNPLAAYEAIGAFVLRIND